MPFSLACRKHSSRFALFFSFVTLMVFNGGCDGGSFLDGPPRPAADRDHYKTFVLVTNSGDNTLSRYALNQDTKTTDFLGTTPVGGSPQSVVIAKINNDIKSHYVYVANSADNTISQFKTRADGSLTPLVPATVATGAEPMMLASGAQFEETSLTGTQARIYCANRAGHSISVFSINNDTGSLQLVSTVSLSSAPSALAVQDTGINLLAPSSKAVYAISSQDDVLTQFSIVPDAEGGLKRATPFTVTAGQGKVAVANGAGKSLFVANGGNPNLMEFNYVTQETAPSQIGNLIFTYPLSSPPVALAVDISANLRGSYLYVQGSDGKLTRYSIAHAALSAPIPNEGEISEPVIFNVTTPQPVSLTPWNGHYLFLAGAQDNLLTTVYNSQLANPTSKSSPTGNHPTSIGVYELFSDTGNVQTNVK